MVIYLFIKFRTKKPQPCFWINCPSPTKQKIFYAFREFFKKYQHIKTLLNNKWRPDCHPRQNVFILPYHLPEVFHMVFYSRKTNRMLQCIQVSQGLCRRSPVHICGRIVFMQHNINISNQALTNLRQTEK